jgi:hypothetical protein
MAYFRNEVESGCRSCAILRGRNIRQSRLHGRDRLGLRLVGLKAQDAWVLTVYAPFVEDGGCSSPAIARRLQSEFSKA